MSNNDNAPSWLYDEEKQLQEQAPFKEGSPTHMPGWLKHPPSENSSVESTLQKKIRNSSGCSGRNQCKGLINRSNNLHRTTDDESCCPESPWQLFFQLFHFFSGVFATLAFVTNIYYVFYFSADFRNKVIHLYAALFCLQIVAIELEVPFVMTRLRIMEWWIIRGLLFLFVGCLTIEENRSTKYYRLSLLIQDLSGLAVVIIAALYIIMGLCCVNRLVPLRASGGNLQYQEISTNVTPAKD